MSHDDVLSLSMFWVGAMFVFTPVIIAGVVIAVIWWGRRHPRDASPDALPRTNFPDTRPPRAAG